MSIVIVIVSTDSAISPQHWCLTLSFPEQPWVPRMRMLATYGGSLTQLLEHMGNLRCLWFLWMNNKDSTVGSNHARGATSDTPCQIPVQRLLVVSTNWWPLFSSFLSKQQKTFYETIMRNMENKMRKKSRHDILATTTCRSEKRTTLSEGN